MFGETYRGAAMAKNAAKDRAGNHSGGLKRVFSTRLGNEGSRLYAVFHIKRNAPEEIIVEKVMAADETSARAIAGSLLGNIVILYIRPDEEQGDTPRTPTGYPSARFIHGRFLAGTHMDEALLLRISD